MSPCDRLRHHLSALADGELTALESIAIRRHLVLCPACRDEVRGLEDRKLALHLAGTAAGPDDALRSRWRAAIEARGLGAPARRRSRFTAPGLAAAAVAFTLAVLLFRPPAAPANARPELDRPGFARMVEVHRGAPLPARLADFVSAGALVAFDTLPGRFLPPDGPLDGDEARVVHASYADCDASRAGASLAVLDAGRVELPNEIEWTLLADGVWLDVEEGVEIRVTRSGDKLFVLLSDLEPSGRGTNPI